MCTIAEANGVGESMSVAVSRFSFLVLDSQSQGDKSAWNQKPETRNGREEQVLFDTNRRIHFVGIGGIGMSGIAEVLLNLGYHVSGSDLAESETTRRLAALGRSGRRAG